MTTTEQLIDSSICDMYESNKVKAGEIISEGLLHYGYFDDVNRDASLADGSRRFTDIMIHKTSVSQGDIFCDFGCGVGVPAIMLARTKGCRINAVTISKHQRNVAEYRARKEGVDDIINFIHANALLLPFNNNSHDGGWFFESISHMGHLPALVEAFRILKPEAELLIADLIVTDDTDSEFAHFAKKHVHSEFISMAQYKDILDLIGFDIVELVDVSNEVSKPFPEKFQQAFSSNQHKIHQLVDPGTINQWIETHKIISENLGYVTLKLIKRDTK